MNFEDEVRRQLWPENEDLPDRADLARASFGLSRVCEVWHKGQRLFPKLRESLYIATSMLVSVTEKLSSSCHN